MTGYIFPLTSNENPGMCGYPYINAHRDRLVPFDFEESSIDLGLSVTPKIVLNNVVYDPQNQYFEKDSNTVNRIILVSPCLTDKELPDDRESDDTAPTD